MPQEVNATIENLIEAMTPIIHILSWEEERVLRELEEIAQPDHLDREIITWSLSHGIHGREKRRSAVEEESTRQPEKALQYVLDYRGNSQDDNSGVIFVFKDFHPFMKGERSELVIRMLRDVAAECRHSSTLRKTLILLSPVSLIPPELEKDITVIDYPLPDQDELGQVLEKSLSRHKQFVTPSQGEEKTLKEHLVKAALGLTENEAHGAFEKLFVGQNVGRKLDETAVDAIAHEKEQTILKSGVLEFQSSGEKFDSVGGLDELKRWLGKRATSFTQEAREFGLPEPKGMLLLGIPGCGKSLCAKVVAAEWHKPLLRLDIGRIFGGLVGSSEENMRRAIKVAESVAPCVLWLDEIEKGFAGMQGGGDSGVTARVFGTLLTWMQEKTEPVFVVATANDISQLPPELLRKGRFDEIFFVDLPAEEEREAIFRIHIGKRSNTINKLEGRWEHLNFKEFTKKTEGFSGAEIEQTVISVLFDAHYLIRVHKQQEEETANSYVPPYETLILDAIEHSVPLSHAMKATVNALREWAKTRARFASSQKEPRENEQKTEATQQQSRFRIPFRFNSGERARSIQQLIEICNKYQDEATGYLRDGRMEGWLRQNGLDDLANKTAELEKAAESEYAFQHFLHEARECLH